MERVPIRPGRSQIYALLIGLSAVCAVMVLVPQLCMPLSLLIPLLACPLAGRREEPIVYVAAAMPAVSSLIEGYDPFYSVSLCLAGALALLVTKLLPQKKRAGASGILWYVGAVACGLTAVALSAGRVLGGPLWKSLAALMTDAVARNEQAGLLLYRFAAAGLISLPEGYAGGTLLAHVLEPMVVRQMLMSLSLTLEKLLFDLIPAFFVQASLLVGLFTSLRVQRMNGVILLVEAQISGEKKARVAVPPGFRLLTLPPKTRWPIMLMAVAALVMMSANAPVAQIVGQMCYTLFETTFMLVGAAVVVFMVSRSRPDRTTLSGILAAALYVMLPFMLFLIGLTDQTFHYRLKRSGSPD